MNQQLIEPAPSGLKQTFSAKLPWLLLALGLSQMAASVSGLKPVQAIAAATCAAPRPKVFSAVKGLETFSSKFELHWQDKTGKSHLLVISPEKYARLQGPYNRRNVYGAAFAYGPVLEADGKYGRPMLQSVLRYSLTDKAPLLRELNLDPSEINLESIRIHVVPRSGTKPEKDLKLKFQLQQIKTNGAVK